MGTFYDICGIIDGLSAYTGTDRLYHGLRGALTRQLTANVMLVDSISTKGNDYIKLIFISRNRIQRVPPLKKSNTERNVGDPECLTLDSFCLSCFARKKRFWFQINIFS